jgi:hypothetical protein
MTTKKAGPIRPTLFVVLRVGESFHEIRDEITRRRDILTVPYQEFLFTGNAIQELGVT